MVKHSILILALAVAGSSLHGQGISQQDLADQAKRLERLGEQWVQSGQLDESQEAYRDEIRALKSITIDQAALAPLKAVLNAQRKDPIDLFVANRLLRPLQWSKVEVIREGLPMVKAFIKGKGAFQDLPVYSEEKLEYFRPPDGADEATRKRFEQRQKEKLDKETPIKLHNEQVSQLQTLLFNLMVLANDQNEDTELFKLMGNAETRGWWTYAEIAEVFRGETHRMVPERAKALYLLFERRWNELREQMEQQKLKVKEYVDYGEVELRATDNSVFKVHKENPCPRLLRTINFLAPMARMPALKDPKGKDTGSKASGKQPATPGGGSKRQAPAGGGAQPAQPAKKT
ncbi:MAG: hypothetical protein BWX88_02348 [Planctomycetes bacterium ADurb.Bin126]|nr:MAG: hypothetical protein BWX88_02348 [Planctomycetes bacterium ADurb.Bin126]HOD84515.1 hypothetical protein [Phycisphaerae bacterium]HQL75527.1 hypothetical protein [Phycisphaerae bacterium]